MHLHSIEDEKAKIGRRAHAANQSRKAGFTMKDQSLVKRVEDTLKLVLDLQSSDVYTNYYTNEMAVKIQLIPTRYQTDEFKECCEIIREICGATPHIGQTKDVRIFTIPKSRAN